MPKVVLFNKPFNVLTQFRPDGDRPTLAGYIHDPGLRVAGRLDRDSEGLLLLTDDGVLNARITQPTQQQFKTYWVQLDGLPNEAALAALRQGVLLNDGLTLPAKAEVMEPPPGLWLRTPPVRFRALLPTSWLQISICEGRNDREMIGARYTDKTCCVASGLPDGGYSLGLAMILCAFLAPNPGVKNDALGWKPKSWR